MVKTIGRLTFVGLALVRAAVPALATDGYAVRDLGTLPGKANSWVWQQSINESGAVPAYANDIPNPNAFFGDVPFLWNTGKITVLPELEGAIDTIPYSLNDSGQVVVSLSRTARVPTRFRGTGLPGRAPGIGRCRETGPRLVVLIGKSRGGSRPWASCPVTTLAMPMRSTITTRLLAIPSDTLRSLSAWSSTPSCGKGAGSYRCLRYPTAA
jgi:hypothetical protein